MPLGAAVVTAGPKEFPSRRLTDPGNSAFIGTTLEAALRNLAINRFIIVGLTTSQTTRNKVNETSS